MKKVERSEILDYVTYEKNRKDIRNRAMMAKNNRRVHLGAHFTFLFENHETIRYQVLEMVLSEKIVEKASIQHEIDTYNELIGEDGVVGCTLLIEIDDKPKRDILLKKWKGILNNIYLTTEDALKVNPQYDQRQVGEKKLSSVQFLKFDTKRKLPLKIGIDHPELTLEAPIENNVQKALKKDLGI